MPTHVDLSGMNGRDLPDDWPSVNRGVIRTSPASLEDSITVEVQAFGSAMSFECPGGNWGPRGELLPTAPAACVVMIDDQQDVWVTMWNPYQGV
jgi:hypothetical protein